ncbi:MAG TPA: rhamnogalacturonan acetylesterase [Trebonia sp.]|nr:rhamnogalacturonan acetylesterase [Trebonia sp.]HVW22508.1 rhamnogalacturonan acetylesterase [Opitutaceae bacterium]
MPRFFPLLALGLVSAAAVSAAPASWKFQLGTGPAAPGFTAVAPGAAYADAAGYGYEPGPSGGPVYFSVKVPEGDYRVTVTLGDARFRAVTTVKAEVRRLMLERIATAPGEFLRRTFAVNVRTPRLSDGSEPRLDGHEVDAATHRALSRDWDDRLTLEFSGENPAPAAVEIEPARHVTTLFITGDSTVTDQPAWPGSSWGQMVTRWFKPEVAVANHAESGETLKGFLRERRWAKVLDSIRPGDYVIIEFGTNDSKSSGPQNIYPGQDFSETYAPAATTYRELLRRFARDAQARGATPIIVSPSARRGELGPPTSLEPWARAAMAVARELGVAGIDLNAMGVELNRALGPDAGKQFNDRTHHVEYGSYLQAKCVVLGIRRAGLPLAAAITDDFRFDPARPEPGPADFRLPRDPGRRDAR